MDWLHLDSSSPWQLYVFCVLQAVAAWLTFSFLPPSGCKVSFGKQCNDAETYLQDCVAEWFVWLAVQFFVLTYANRNNAAKLKRLAIYATYCTLLSLATLVMVGVENHGGLLCRWCHLVWFIVSLVVLVMLATIVTTDAPVAASEGCFSNMGWNHKVYQKIVAIVIVIHVILMNYVYTVENCCFVDASLVHKSDIANVAYKAWCVWALQGFLVTLYSIQYGDEKDREWFTIASIVLFVVPMLVEMYWHDVLTGTEVRSTHITLPILIGLGLATEIKHRLRGRRGGYQEVGSSNI